MREKYPLFTMGRRFSRLTHFGIRKAVQHVVDQLNYRASDPFVGHGVATLTATHIQVIGRQPLPNLVWMADSS
jgi:hypothetical protein